MPSFEASLKTAPARFRSFYGAAKAAEQAGNPPVARQYYEKLIAVAAHADPGRPELAEAKKVLLAKQ